MDWGRGNWPYRSFWIWGSAMGVQEGKKVALNIGELIKTNTS